MNKKNQEEKMPEITLDIKPSKVYLFTTGKRAEDMNLEFEICFTKALEYEFGLEGKKDVDFKIISTNIIHSNEKIVDIAVSINYTVDNAEEGEDEYDQGEPFNPPNEKQKALFKIIKFEFDRICNKYNLPRLSFSVWCLPHMNAAYEAWE